jgi:hypothetical protein
VNYVTFPNMTISWGSQEQTYFDVKVPVFIVDNWLYIEPKDWAPGLWVGTEGLIVKLTIKGKDYPAKVLGIDLHYHKVAISY